ncbi:hypothetical protein T492DRAFT_888032 [Pavlovales sp. CCMP2436]|nr:hypothetical protein T492DRAFT_888032 [Pavlovales sp. CCMP2436]
MLYVNRIAAIVHACVHEFAGAINKNIGEAFLMPIESIMEMMRNFSNNPLDKMKARYASS